LISRIVISTVLNISLLRTCPENVFSSPRILAFTFWNSSREKICSSVRPSLFMSLPNKVERIVWVPSSRTTERSARFCGCRPLFLSASVNFFPDSGFTSKYLGSKAWTITARVRIVSPGLISESFLIWNTADSITFSNTSLLSFTSPKEERCNSPLRIFPFEISIVEPSLSLPFSINSMWAVSQKTVLMFEVSSARRNEATLPSLLFLLKVLTGFNLTILPILHPRFHKYLDLLTHTDSIISTMLQKLLINLRIYIKCLNSHVI